MRFRINRTWLFIASLVIAFLMGMTWLNFTLLTTPFFSDSAFVLPYTAVKAFFSDGTSPYDESLITRAETSYVGEYGSGDENRTTGRFLLPLFATFLYLPFTWIGDPRLAYAAFLTFMECCIGGGIAVLWRTLDWKVPPAVLVMYVFLSAASFFMIQPLVRANPILAVNFFFLAGLLALHTRFEEVAAILFSMTLIKPYLLILPFIFLITWALFQQRWRFLIWLFSMAGILVFFSISLQPDWIIQNLREAYRLYQDQNLTFVMLSVLPEGGTTALRLMYISVGVLAFLLLLEWFFARHADFVRFLLVLSLTLVVNQILLPENNPGNLALLYLPVAMIMTSIGNRLGKEGSALMQFLLGCALLVPWFLQVLGFIRSGGEFKVLWEIPALEQVAALWLLTLGLYWVRWWIIHPVQFSLDRE